ncbi:MAG: hypothetical protein IKC31_03750 [Clostridia bacterium]|nr:hypothetical protein [Clostridia bacterium]
MKRLVCAALAVLLLLSSSLTLSSCGGKAPKIEQIYDRVVELVEASHEINTVFYGAGLPVYARDSLYAEFSHLYYNFSQNGYEIVTDYAKFLTIHDIKTAAEKVYSKAYLEEVLYPMAFEGHAITGIGGVEVAMAKYREDEQWIYQSEDAQPLYAGMIVYDYSTMKITRPSNAKACYVTVNAWNEDEPQAVRSVRLRLTLGDDGNWYLDSFTGGRL